MRVIMSRRSVTISVVVSTFALAACSPNTSETEATTAPRETVLFEPSASSSAPATTTATTTTTIEPAPTSDPAPTTTSDATTTTTTSTTTTSTTTTLPPAPLPEIEALTSVELALEPVVELRSPLAIAWRPDDPAMYVAGRFGEVWSVVDGSGTVVLDLGDRVSEGAERGLLGIAFDPRDGRMFLDFTDLDGHTNIRSWELVDGAADPASEREVLFQEQPGPGHNAGGLQFDADGHLFASFGDGGASNGRDAQDPAKIFGSIIRILPNLDEPGYTVPDDNPFVGVADHRDEPIVRGLRNPWRFSLDPPTGDIWLGDVGNEEFEEVDRIQPSQWGASFGWYWVEGNNVRRSGAPEGQIAPVHAYSHQVGVAAVGGYVYRGDEVPGLAGAYLFGDFNGRTWLIGSDGLVATDLPLIRRLASFGQDPAGELYVVSLDGAISRIVGAAAG